MNRRKFLASVCILVCSPVLGEDGSGAKNYKDLIPVLRKNISTHWDTSAGNCDFDIVATNSKLHPEVGVYKWFFGKGDYNTRLELHVFLDAEGAHLVSGKISWWIQNKEEPAMKEMGNIKAWNEVLINGKNQDVYGS